MVVGNKTISIQQPCITTLRKLHSSFKNTATAATSGGFAPVRRTPSNLEELWMIVLQATQASVNSG